MHNLGCKLAESVPSSGTRWLRNVAMLWWAQEAGIHRNSDSHGHTKDAPVSAGFSHSGASAVFSRGAASRQRRGAKDACNGGVVASVIARISPVRIRSSDVVPPAGMFQTGVGQLGHDRAVLPPTPMFV